MRPRQRPLRSAAAWAALAILALGTLAAVAAAQEDPDELSPETVARGNLLYQELCAACHGAGGGGREDAAPPLLDVSIAYLDLVLRTGRMPPGDEAGQTKGSLRFSDSDREALVAWVSGAFDLEGRLPTPEIGDPARGREVYAANCAHCHGYTGAGGVAGAGAFTPQVSGLDPTTIALATRVGPFEMPRFASDQISDPELGDVAAYLAEVAHEEGTPLNLVELNPVYVSAFVALLALIALVSLVWLGGRVQMFPDPEPPGGTNPRPPGRADSGDGGDDQ